MSYTSITITKKAANVWFIKDNTTPVGGNGHSSNEWSGTANNNYITIKTEIGQIIYNKEPYSVFHYVDELDSGNNLATPASPLQLMTHLTQQGFFPDSSGGEGDTPTIQELSNSLIPNLYGRAGQYFKVADSELGFNTGNPAFDAQNNKLLYIPNGWPGTGPVTTADAAEYVNTFQSISIGETRTPVVIGLSRNENGISKRYFFFFRDGKNINDTNWGLGGNPVTASQFIHFSTLTITQQDIVNTPNSEIFNLGDVTGQNYWEVANLQDPPYNLTDSGVEDSDGNPRTYFFSFIEDGVTYFATFVGAPGYYGVGENQFTEADLVVTTNSNVLPEGVQTVTGDLVDNTDPLNPVIGTPNIQQVSENGNTTTEKIGIGTDTIDDNVILLKVGTDIPKDDKNLVAISYTYNIEQLEGAGNNGLNVDIKGVGTEDTGIRAVRHKFISNIDPNGFNFTNSGGSAIGAENVARITGTVGGAGGEIDALVATYSRVSSNINDVNYIVNNAVGHLLPPPSHLANPDNPFVRYAAILVSNQVFQNNATNTAELFLGNTVGEQAMMPETFLGHWSVYNMSPYPSSQLSGLKLGGNEVPTEILDVVGNGKFSGNITATSIIKSGSSGNSILLGDGNVFDLNRVHTITTSTQNGNIDLLTTDGIYLIGSSATGTLPSFQAGMFEVLRNGNVFITQIAFGRGSNNRMAIRQSSDSGSTWSSWAEVASTSYADAKVANDLTASTTVSPSKTAVNTALGTKLTVIASGSSSLYFGSIATMGYEDITVSLSGVVVGNKVVLTVPLSAMSPLVEYKAWVSASGQLTIRCTNYSGSSFDAPDSTFSFVVF